jgi:hypothetical protein
MTHEITASWNTLMGQSKDTAQDYFATAHKMMEGSGLEYTAADVVALTKVMAMDFHTASMGVATQKLCEAITSVGGGLNGISEALVGIECGLDGIAESVGGSVDGLAVCVSNLQP